MIQDFTGNMKKEYVDMRMDLSFDVPPELAEQIELWGIYRFERCEYDQERRQMCLSARTRLYRTGA